MGIIFVPENESQQSSVMTELISCKCE